MTPYIAKNDVCVCVCVCVSEHVCKKVIEGGKKVWKAIAGASLTKFDTDTEMIEWLIVLFLPNLNLVTGFDVDFDNSQIMWAILRSKI
jgi:hypothetical protein